jgi:hypothetical protein
VNWVPLSVMMEFGTPKRWMMLVKNATSYSDLMLVRDRTSIHLENLSMATSRCEKPPGAFCKGSTRSKPHTANGQVMGIVGLEQAGASVSRRIDIFGKSVQS